MLETIPKCTYCRFVDQILKTSKLGNIIPLLVKPNVSRKNDEAVSKIL